MSIELDTEMLISQVERRLQIWDASHEGYKNREVRSKAWQQITKNLIQGFEGLNEADQKKCVDKVQKRWKTARDAYFKSRNKIINKKSGSAVTKIPKYIYQDQLSFLDRIREGPTESNIGSPSETVSQDIDYNNDPLAEDEPSEEQIDHVRPNLSTEKQSFKRKRPARNSSFEDNLLSLLKDNKDKEEDDDRAFLTSLLPTLKSLNGDQKLLFRSQVLQLIMSIKRTNQANMNIQPPFPSASFHYPSTSFNFAPLPINQQHPNQFMQFQQDPFIPIKVATPNPSPALSTQSISSWETL